MVASSTAVPPACQPVKKRKRIVTRRCHRWLASSGIPLASWHGSKGISSDSPNRPCSRRLGIHILLTSLAQANQTHSTTTFAALCQSARPPVCRYAQLPSCYEVASHVRFPAFVATGLCRFCGGVRGTRTNMSIGAQSKLKISRLHGETLPRDSSPFCEGSPGLPPGINPRICLPR